MPEQLSEDWERAGGEHGVRLRVAAGDDVAERAQGRRHHVQLARGQARHQGRHGARGNHLLDLLVGAVRQVGQGPAGVGWKRSNQVRNSINSG